MYIHGKKWLTFSFIFQIMEELTSNGVEIYRFPVDDETVAEMNAGMNVRELINHVPTTLYYQIVTYPLHRNIKMHFLHDVLYKFPQVLTRRICFKNRELPYTVFIFTRQFFYLSVCMLRVRVSKLVIFFSGANSICCCWKPWRGYYQQSEDESQTISLGDCRRYCTCTLFVTSQLTWKRSWLLAIVSC